MAHFLEDSLVNGEAISVDDAILEKGNRRMKRLGDRCTWRGPNRQPGSKFFYEKSVLQADGSMSKVKRARLCNEGAATGASKLELAGKLVAAREPSRQSEKARQEVAAHAAAKAGHREECRGETKGALSAMAGAMK